MPVKTKLKSRIIDDKDKEILMILQEDARQQLTKIAKQVGLSIDSVHKRIKEMIRKEIFYSTILINPRVVGFPLIMDIKIRLKNTDEEQKNKFISYLKTYSRCASLLSIMGDYDFTCVLFAKNSKELEKISTEIREKFKSIIDEWKGKLVLDMYKFEHYDLIK